jgi:prolyl oligopeptidase
VDDYHGTKVSDPYRWLEDADTPESQKWVAAENALTRSYLDALPGREALKKRLTELYDYPRTSVPQVAGGRYFYTRNPGLKNQAILYVQQGASGAPRVLLDPNTLSADGTVALTAVSPSTDGALLGYGLSRSGSDRQEIMVRDVATGKDLADTLRWVKFTNIAWRKDGSGFYYTRFPEPGSVPASDENYFGKVYYHKLGDPQARDRLVYEDPAHKDAVPGAAATRDGRYVIIDSELGASDKSEISIIDLGASDVTPRPLFRGYTEAYNFVESVNGRLYFYTDKGAPRGRIVCVDYGAGERETREVVPESTDRLSGYIIANGRLVLTRLHNASEQVSLYALDGTHEADLPLPSLGSVVGMSGEPDQPDLFLNFMSFVDPGTVYRYDFRARRLTEFYPRAAAAVRPDDYEIKQVWYPSKDGTKISMFLVSRKGLKLDGKRPVFLTGYGGFNVSMTPYFRPSVFVWLDRGGVLAEPNLRGGGEYGEEWHQAGMLEKKQNVFDDFIAAAEWLIANHYTAASRLAIEGGSNGGLLVSACEVQRPDLFGAVICRVPVADMLRYDKLTVGRFWIPEYGTADDPTQFAFLYKYSPLHNVKDGVAYPATLITTADHDDRVAPGLAKKFAARMQAATGGVAPILIRIETKAGHGGGKPTSKRIEEEADVWSFLFAQLDVTP